MRSKPEEARERLEEAIPRLGWVSDPSPVTALPGLAEELGLRFFGVKRDDLCPALHGGSKPRKLDYLLGAAPLADAPSWAAVGAIGSGNLVALTAAAAKLGRTLHAHAFWSVPTDEAIENLAFTASGPTAIDYYRSRFAIGTRRPRLFLASHIDGVPIVPLGGTSALGTVGLVRAGLELGRQVHEGELPVPERLYVALGSCGTAAGLSVGLALAGLATTVVAVAVVERFATMERRVRAVQRSVLALLAARGLRDLPEPAPIRIDRGHLGRAYSVPTAEGLAACRLLAEHDILLEPAYTAKAMASLISDAKAGRAGAVLFWHTARRGPLPHANDWRARLPPALARRLAAAEARPRAALSGGEPPRWSRRRVLVTLGAAATASAAVAHRVSGYPDWPSWSGAVLRAWEAQVIAAAADALLPPAPDHGAYAAVPGNVDRYLVGMPERLRTEVHALLVLIEHGTTPLGGRMHRFTLLDRPAREAYLSGLASKGGLATQAYRGLRDLCLTGYYTQPASWVSTGYEGPRMPAPGPRGEGRVAWPSYDALVSPEGAVPEGTAR